MYKIIFLDDEMMTLKLLEHAVDWQKYKIDLCGSASDGEEGIALFQQVQPDIVITDIRMPRMNGIELAAALRQTTKKAKILLFSAYAEFEYAQSAITYEISEYLLKPLDEDKLEAAIARIVQELDREQALSSTIESYRLEQAERQLQQLFAGGRSGARRDLPVPLPDQIAAACGPVDTLLACVCTAEPHEPELRSDVEVVRLRLKEQLGPMTPIVAISPVELIALAAASRLGPQFATLADTKTWETSNVTVGQTIGRSLKLVAVRENEIDILDTVTGKPQTVRAGENVSVRIIEHEFDRAAQETASHVFHTDPRGLQRVASRYGVGASCETVAFAGHSPCRITAVAKHSLADRLDLKVGDLVVSSDGQPVTPDSLASVLRSMADTASQARQLTIARHGVFLPRVYLSE